MNLLIVEPTASGHRMILYTRMIIRAARFQGFNISLLTTPSNLKHESYAILNKEAGTEIQVYFMEPVKPAKNNNIISLFVYQVQCYKKINKSFVRIFNKKPLPDLVFVPGFEDFDKALSIFGSPFGTAKFSGILVSVKFYRHKVGLGPPSRFDNLFKLLFNRILNIGNLEKLFVVDSLFYDFFIQKNKKSHKLALLPEVGEIVRVETKVEARRYLGLDPTAFIVLIYGSLTKRKGIDSVLLAANSEDAPENILIVLAGVPDSYINDRLSMSLASNLRLKGIIKEFLFFHNDEEERRIFCAADVIWLGYFDFFDSSGVIYQACSIGCPVVGSLNGIIGWLIKKYNIGLAVDAKNIKEVNDALCELNENKEVYCEFGQNGEKLAASHTAKCFEDILSDYFLQRSN